MIKSQKGQATVELALSLIILLFLVFGIVDFGRIFHAYLTLEHAGREAGRIASLGALDTEVVQRAKESAPSLEANDITISATPSASNRKSGSYVTINMTYPITFSIPLFKEFLPNPLLVSTKTVMRVE
ncbi:TadE/TadG family type IV pilus assembly protein [Bacillus sp. Marseille-P3661]|uniref:TadE/TadG family type IV pilus assembly protein n=1 Tax=Bacillus sp. Marseille-P3661 TaxID=1936234 RepID=UPI0015E18402|nr:TadE/TadG family type IV pilus assembly protein [Bacillus sp. Marseille-P3661]